MHYNKNNTGLSLTSGDYGRFDLTLKVLVMTIDAQWEGMGDIGSARYEPALLPPCPSIRVLSSVVTSFRVLVCEFTALSERVHIT